MRVPRRVLPDDTFLCNAVDNNKMTENNPPKCREIQMNLFSLGLYLQAEHIILLAAIRCDNINNDCFIRENYIAKH